LPDQNSASNRLCREKLEYRSQPKRLRL